jgi:hypothetical protein
VVERFHVYPFFSTSEALGHHHDGLSFRLAGQRKQVALGGDRLHRRNL